MFKNPIKLVALGLVVGGLAFQPAEASGQDATRDGDAFSSLTKKAEERPVRVYVQNNNWLDVRIYAVRGSTRYRMGTVYSQTGQFFELPARLTEAGFQVQLQADPIGSNRTVTTPRVMINPGDIVEWSIENSLDLSSVSVWST